LIAAELVFGTTSGQGGLGWYIFEAKNLLNIPEFLFENVVFRLIEARTIGRWGMQN
jgi:NitT/TauT family transport system permease protein